MSIWLLIGFLKAIPKRHRGTGDGGRLQPARRLLRAVVPLAFPGIVAVIVFAFTLTASEYIYALAFVSPTARR